MNRAALDGEIERVVESEQGEKDTSKRNTAAHYASLVTGCSIYFTCICIQKALLYELVVLPLLSISQSTEDAPFARTQHQRNIVPLLVKKN